VKKWPNFFIVGSGKAGTSSLYYYLKNISGIYMSPVKEPNYFSINTVPENHPFLKPIRSDEKYLELFENVNDEKIIGEASTSYFADPQAPHLIYEKVPNARILISLRNPIEKVYSTHLMLKRQGTFQTSFHERVVDLRKNIKSGKKTGMQGGLYYNYVNRYLDVFGKDQVKIIIFEEWIKDPRPTIKEILKFLGIKDTLNNFQNVIRNPYREERGQIAKYIRESSLVSKIARLFLSSLSRKSLKRKFLLKTKKPTMNEKDREELKKFFYDDVQKLQTLLGRELPWQDFST